MPIKRIFILLMCISLTSTLAHADIGETDLNRWQYTQQITYHYPLIETPSKNILAPDVISSLFKDRHSRMGNERKQETDFPLVAYRSVSIANWVLMLPFLGFRIPSSTHIFHTYWTRTDG